MKALLGTRKGLLVLKEQAGQWKLEKTHFDGVKCNFAEYDAHHDVIWAGATHGHWGAKIHVSKDKGKTFQELSSPVFPEWTKESLKDIWCGVTDPTGRIWLGTEPAGLFYSDDQGKSWTFLESFHRTPGREKWMGAGTDASCLHSLMIHPENPNHFTVGVSVAGALESKDRGKTWKYINKGMKANYLPDPDVEVGQDPHKIVMAPSNPKVLWQQNHCGVFKSEDGGQSWQDLSKAKGLKSAFGWAVAVDEQDPRVAYVIPALSDEVRIPVDLKLFVQKTTDGGKTWKVLNKGMPKEKCYDIVYRSALALKGKSLMFGTTTGRVFFSKNQGAQWKQFPVHTSPVFCLSLF